MGRMGQGGEREARRRNRHGRDRSAPQAGSQDDRANDWYAATFVAARGRFHPDGRTAYRNRAHRQRRHARSQFHRVGQGRYRGAGHPEGGRAGAGHAHLHQEMPRSAGGPPRPAPDAGQRAARGSRDIRDAAQGRLAGRVPGGKPRTDEHAAAPAPARVLRPGDPGSHRAPRPDPGRHGAPLPETPPRRRAGADPRTEPRAWPARRVVQYPGAHAGRADLPGTGDEDRAGRGEVLQRGGEPAAQGHGYLPQPWHGGRTAGHDGGAHGDARIRPRIRPALLQPDPRLWRIWLSRKPRRQLCPPGLCQQLAEMPFPRRLRLRPSQLPAHGLLRTRPDRARCARARGGGAAGGREQVRLGLYAGGDRGG